MPKARDESKYGSGHDDQLEPIAHIEHKPLTGYVVIFYCIAHD